VVGGGRELSGSAARAGGGPVALGAIFVDAGRVD
jgi:hypothetical protein